MSARWSTPYRPCVAALAIAACGGSAEDARGARPRATPTIPTTTPVTAPAPPPTTAQPTPVFEGSAAPISDADRARMTFSWRPGCPVPIEDLRLVAVDHWGYDGAEHRGEVAVHADYADAFVGVFRALFDARFPIERMQLVDVFEADDHASTLANNTAAFNCRSVVGRPGSWSEHAYGRAIDINPRVNPYVLDPRVQHPVLAPYLDRSIQEPGMIRAGDAIVDAFAAIGWQWGGTWSSPGYQHFSATGH